MLLLFRKENETIMIGNNVEVQVISLQGKNVLLGVRAPRSIPVHRREIYDRLQKGAIVNDRLANGGAFK